MELMCSEDLCLNRPGDLLRRDRGWGGGEVCDREVSILPLKHWLR